MKIVCDENILFAKEFFSTLANGDTVELVLKPGREIVQADVMDAECLLVRSITRVDAHLLSNTPVKFVGTATIGTDHVEQTYLQERCVRFADAAGCSKKTVAQYVLAAIYHSRKSYFTKNETAPTLGIVGMGNIGMELAEYAVRLGWQVLGCDPFKPSNMSLENGQIIQNLALKELASQVDVLSLHVPLSDMHESEHPTHHLINADILNEMQSGALLINTARGAVVSEADLLHCLECKKLIAVLDVFEHEPKVSRQLLDKLAIGTPHIAGYSIEGKARGTQIIYEQLSQFLGITPRLKFQQFLPENPYMLSSHECFKQALALVLPDWYNICADDAKLRDCLKGMGVSAACFDGLRKGYALRREWVI